MFNTTEIAIQKENASMNSFVDRNFVQKYNNNKNEETVKNSICMRHSARENRMRKKSY